MKATIKLLLYIIIGALIGIVVLTAKLSNAVSYLSDDPSACVNCHVMYPHYSTWFHGSHRRIANCNDCHVPHDSFVRKYAFKASDGLRHATLFTLNKYPQVIRIQEAGKAVVQENCVRCHLNQIHPVSASNVNGKNYMLGEGHLCWDCHREVPHGRINSQASTPFPISIRKNTDPVPEWIKKQIHD